MKNKNGITLIALIITIIVMLILVAVTVNSIINSDLIDKAKEAKIKYEEEEIFEKMINDVIYSEDYKIDVRNTFQNIKKLLEKEGKVVILVNPTREEQIEKYAVIKVTVKNEVYIYTITEEKIIKGEEIVEEDCYFVTTLVDALLDDFYKGNKEIGNAVKKLCTPKINLARKEEELKKKYENSNNVLVTSKMDFSALEDAGVISDASSWAKDKISNLLRLKHFNYKEIKELADWADWFWANAEEITNMDKTQIEAKTKEIVKSEKMRNYMEGVLNLTSENLVAGALSVLFASELAHYNLAGYTLQVQTINGDTMTEYGINHRGEEYEKELPAYIGSYRGISNQENSYCILELYEDKTGYIEYKFGNIDSPNEKNSNFEYEYTDDGILKLKNFDNANISESLKEKEWKFEFKEKCKFLTCKDEYDYEAYVFVSNDKKNKEGEYSADIGGIKATLVLKDGIATLKVEGEEEGELYPYFTIGDIVYHIPNHNEGACSSLEAYPFLKINDNKTFEQWSMEVE